jgi:hypothetical protein
MKNSTKNGWTLVGECAVDSGQLMVCDPCYIKSHWDSNEFTSSTDEDKSDFSYDGACVTTIRHTAGQLGNSFGARYLGVATSTAGGDGVFPVYVRYENGTAMEFRIMLDGARLTKNGDPVEYSECPDCGSDMTETSCDWCAEEDEDEDE